MRKLLTPKLACLTFILLSFSSPAWSGEELESSKQLAYGEETYMEKCEGCHGRGPQQSGTSRFEKRDKGSVPAALQDRTNLSTALIKTFVRNQTPGMAPFRYTELTEEDLDAVIIYLMRNNK